MKAGAVVLAAALAGLCACASSGGPVAKQNPAHAGTTYSNVLVFAEAPDREWRESLETGLVGELSALGVTATPAFALTDGLSATPAVEAVIVITVSDSGVREEWVRQQAMSSPLSSNTLVGYGGSVAGSVGGATPAQCKTREQSGDGFRAAVPWAVIAISVVDRAARETVWTSALEFKGDIGADFEQLRQDYTRTVARAMSRDGLW